MKNCVVTIVSANYLAYARLLGESIKLTNSCFDFKILIVDRRTPIIEQAINDSGLDVTYADDLPLPDLERLFYKYDIMELNTALKPTFLKQMFRIGYENVIYLDPDIRVFSPLTPVLDALNGDSIVLTPHSLAPVMDSMRPSDVDFLRGGAYNLGFIGLKRSEQSCAMLDWWESRCLGMGFNDQVFGTFVDQKWIDLVPCYFSNVNILRHPGCNVAYWNLHEREIFSKSSGFYINNQPLIFFHFSGIDPFNTTALSKHQNRHKLETGSVLHKLVEDYCALLINLGYTQYSKIPYGFGKLNDGTLITQTMRRSLLVVAYQENDPFNASSRFQRELRAAGISLSQSLSPAKAPNTMNFEQSDRKVRVVNLLIRITFRTIGLPRLLNLLRYLSLLIRETHLPAVLLSRPMDMVHKLRR